MSNNGEKLTTKQYKLAVAYTAFGAETEGNGLLSAIVAGYQGKDNSLIATASRTLAMVKVKQVIDGIIAHRQAVLAEKTGFSIEQAQSEYEEARLLAMQERQPGAAVGAITGKARLYGMDRDAGTKPDAGLTLNFTTIAPKQAKAVVSEVLPEARQDAEDGPERPEGQDKG